MQPAQLNALTNQLPPIVLIVEDHADTVEFYDMLLTSEGYWVARAGNGYEAFEYAQELKPDAIITDLGLPGGMDGIELIRQLRAEPGLQDIPILAITGQEPRDVPSLAGLKMAALLIKPVAPETLLARVKAALAQSVSLRARSAAAAARVEPLLARSAGLLAQARRGAAATAPSQPCPSCGGQLHWIESGTLGGVTYDYYQWCANKCGLYRFNQTTSAFELLATGR